MKIIARVIRWLSGGYEYGDIGDFIEGIFYRRGLRSGEVQYKGDCGKWITINADHWFKFRAHEVELNEIQMPDGSFYSYTDKERDTLGEIEFKRRLADRRRLALEQKLFRRTVLIVNEPPDTGKIRETLEKMSRRELRRLFRP